jgi:ABC-type sugar transport system substrate-binding protein
MKGKRAMTGLLAGLVAAVSLVVVPALSAAPDSPDPKTAGDHTPYTFCHRTGSLSNPFVAVTSDDAAWAEAHQPGSTPAHPPKNDNDDMLIGTNVVDPPHGPIAADECDGKNPPDDGGK